MTMTEDTLARLQTAAESATPGSRRWIAEGGRTRLEAGGAAVLTTASLLGPAPADEDLLADLDRQTVLDLIAEAREAAVLRDRVQAALDRFAESAFQEVRGFDVAEDMRRALTGVEATQPTPDPEPTVEPAPEPEVTP